MTLKITNPTWKTLVLLLIWLDPIRLSRVNICQIAVKTVLLFDWNRSKASKNTASLFIAHVFDLRSFLLAEKLLPPKFFQTAKKIGWCEVMLYEMLVGSRPFKGTNNIFVLYCNLSAHVSESLQSIRISESYHGWVSKAPLAKVRIKITVDHHHFPRLL